MVRRVWEIMYEIERGDETQEQRIIDYQKAVIDKLIDTNKKQKELIEILMEKLKKKEGKMK